ncbi:MAG: efflux RND transporter periplasmic adaptor subunit [Saprospiraceae bacterium]|nr:efflux RND transporter periplasmic adaptor subunit [Candidatus Vicinibacter affinis]
MDIRNLNDRYHTPNLLFIGSLFDEGFLAFFFIAIFILACDRKVQKVRPTVGAVTESIYASGVVRSKNQYQAFATVSGVINKLYVSEGDTVKKGTPILSISSEIQRLNRENAELNASFTDIQANQGKLSEAKMLIDFSFNKMKNDSLLYFRQKSLWQQEIGSKAELEQKELAYQNSRTSYLSSILRYNDLKRQLTFNSSQAKKNLLISNSLKSEYILRSEIDGMVYSISKNLGEIVGPQSPICVIGDAGSFILEMEVDEFDIIKIRKDLRVHLTLDSYRGKIFEAKVTKINPIMNERSKTFLVEAEFMERPEILYPNISFEANIVISSKDKAMLIPRKYLVNDSMVIKSNGEKVIVKIGLKDYQKVEILSGVSPEDELLEPPE